MIIKGIATGAETLASITWAVPAASPAAERETVAAQDAAVVTGVEAKVA